MQWKIFHHLDEIPIGWDKGNFSFPMESETFPQMTDNQVSERNGPYPDDSDSFAILGAVPDLAGRLLSWTSMISLNEGNFRQGFA